MIAIASDHAGFEMKKLIIEYLNQLGIKCRDFGTDSATSCHYPDFASAAAAAVTSGECERGILICGTGVGMSIAANKHKGIRCVVCSEPYSAKMSREHNDTNMLAIGSRVVGIDLAEMIIKTWLEAEYAGGRHQIRIDLISDIEENN